MLKTYVTAAWLTAAAASFLVTPAQAQPQAPAAPPQSSAASRPAAADAAAEDPATFELWKSGRYRLTPSDVVELIFPYVPEFDQTVTVQPDGYISLRAVGDLRVQSRTLPELRQLLYDAYEPILKNPTITIVLKEFEKPYFVTTGEVAKPGKYELRGTTTVTDAIAQAGGVTDRAKYSQVILFRRYSSELLEVKEINVGKMLATKDLSEDYVVRPGDTIFIPRTLISRLKPYIPTAGLGFYLNPFSR
jgi:polysaccharide biosynthesis/export protein